MAADRQPKMRAMIMAETEEDRRRALDALLPLQQQDFERLFDQISGLLVTIQLVDPPLHEFLPNPEEIVRELERLSAVDRQHDLELRFALTAPGGRCPGAGR